MHKQICTFLVVLISFISYSQNSNSRELVVEGSAVLKVKPDVVSLSFMIIKTDSVQSRAIEQTNFESEKLIQLLKSLGFSSSDIKLSDYDVNYSLSSYDSRRNPVYSARNELSVRFRLNEKLLDLIYTSFQEGGFSGTNLLYNTELSDSLSEASKNKLVQMAIASGKKKANQIAANLDIKLGKIKEARTASRRYTFQNDLNPNIETEYSAPYRGNIFRTVSIAEKELSESITIVFEING